MDTAVIIFFLIMGACLYAMVKCLDKRLDCAFKIMHIRDARMRSYERSLDLLKLMIDADAGRITKEEFGKKVSRINKEREADKEEMEEDN